MIQPEPGMPKRQESQMATMLHRQQTQIRIACESRLIEHFEGNQRIVLRLNQQRRHTDQIQKLPGRLRPIIIRRSAESEKLGCIHIVELKDRRNGVEALHAVALWIKLMARTDALLYPAQEPPLVQKVRPPLQQLHTCRQIDRGRYA